MPIAVIPCFGVHPWFCHLHALEEHDDSQGSAAIFESLLQGKDPEHVRVAAEALVARGQSPIPVHEWEPELRRLLRRWVVGWQQCCICENVFLPGLASTETKRSKGICALLQGVDGICRFPIQWARSHANFLRVYNSTFALGFSSGLRRHSESKAGLTVYLVPMVKHACHSLR